MHERIPAEPTPHHPEPARLEESDVRPSSETRRALTQRESDLRDVTHYLVTLRGDVSAIRDPERRMRALGTTAHLRRTLERLLPDMPPLGGDDWE